MWTVNVYSVSGNLKIALEESLSRNYSESDLYILSPGVNGVEMTELGKCAVLLLLWQCLSTAGMQWCGIVLATYEDDTSDQQCSQTTSGQQWRYSMSSAQSHCNILLIIQ